jgi:hypothetical protein
MTVNIPLLSIASVAFLGLALLLGGTPSLYSIDMSFTFDSDHLMIAIDPVILVWQPQVTMNHIGANGIAYGCAMYIRDDFRDTLYGDYVLAHESNHIEQFHALSWLIYPSQLFLPIEPPTNVLTDWNDLTQPNRTMWLPPENWHDLWHFLTIILYPLA